MKSPLLLLAASFALGILLVRPEHVVIPQAFCGIPVLLAAGSLCLLAGLIVLLILSRGRGGDHLPPEQRHSHATAYVEATADNSPQRRRISEPEWLGVCECCALVGFIFAGAAAGRLFE